MAKETFCPSTDITPTPSERILFSLSNKYASLVSGNNIDALGDTSGRFP